MGVYATINISFECMALFLSLAALLFVSFFPRFRDREKIDFIVFLAILVISAFFNGMFTIFNGKADSTAKTIQVVSRFISITIGCWFSAFFTVYLYHLFGRNEKGYRIWNAISFAVAGALTVSLIFNLFFGFFYTFDENGTYIRGIYYYLIPTIATLIWLVDAVLVLINRNRLCKQDRWTFYCYFVMLVSALILQCFFRKLAFVDAITVLAIVVLVFGEQSKNTERLLQERIRAEEARLEAAQTKERLMRSQVSPHFIFNALTAIQALPDNPDATKKAIGDFAKYLRQSLSTINDNTLIPFEKEWENVQIYFRLEKIRFGKSLQVEYDIGEEDFDLPAMSVQILAENAVKHGVSVRRDGGTVKISTKREGDEIVICVQDDGVGFDATKQMDASYIGIDNVRNRLKTMVDGTLSIDSEPGKGTTATIRFSCI